MTHSSIAISFFMDSHNFNIIAWNIRGGMGARGRRRVTDLIQTYRPSLFAVCETHCKFDRAASFWQRQRYELIREVEVVGHSGGLWILAPQQRNFTVTFLEASDHTISVVVDTPGRSWVCTALYASPNPVKRLELWDYLVEFRRRCTNWGIGMRFAPPRKWWGENSRWRELLIC